jgi:sulfoxide reductase catalytic subunit YedY
MLVKKSGDISANEITEEKSYLNRRNFIRGGMLAGTAGVTATVYRRLAVPAGSSESATEATYLDRKVDGEDLTSYEDITTYNNFYEFSTSKEGVARLARNFTTRPWTVEVTGLVNRPRTFDLDEIVGLGIEERVYRFRCVEAWSMVIPWLGVPLARLLALVEPLGNANFVSFQTLLDPARMPNQRTQVLDWPYVEGLRLDEALHPLTLLSTGLYGRLLLPQNGAPIRLVVPWKYGFKSIKSIVRIELTDRQPTTTWSSYAPDEYGFYLERQPRGRPSALESGP